MNTTEINSFFKADIQEAVTQHMLPALVKCFGIIILGYIFGCFNLLSQPGTKGLCMFVQYLALPALIFTSLATVTASNINWYFIAAILVSKTIVFTFTAIATMIMTKPVHIGKAGIYAIASTQSNDLALGYPLMLSLYKITHPTFPTILYIVVPIQLLILNPIGFFLLEMFKRKESAQYSREHSMFFIFKETIKNPFIVATIIGIIWNFIFHHYVPPVIDDILQSLGIVFSPLALFLLGHCMSCGVKAVKGYFSLIPAVLVLIKIFVLPLVIQKTAELFLNDIPDDQMQSFSSLGFLYGTIPSAPTVFIFAKQYSVAVNTIASVTVYSTLFSAPLMIISATMISLSQNVFENMENYFSETIKYISPVNFFCCLIVLIIIVKTKKWKDICTVSVIYIIFAQILTSIGSAFLFLDFQNKHFLTARYILSLGGIILTRLFAVFLGFILFLLQKRSLCYVLKHKAFIYTVIGLLIPFGITAILLFFLVNEETPHKSLDLDFKFNYTQVVVILTATVVMLALITVFLILQQRFMKENRVNENMDSQRLLGDGHVNHSRAFGSSSSESDLEHFLAETNVKVPSDIEDVANEFEEITGEAQQVAQRKIYFKPTCNTRYKCNAGQRSQCSSQVENYEQNTSILHIEINAEYVRYIIILMSISTSMLISIMVCVSWIISQTSSGICVELKFLNIILSYSQGIICMILYSFDEIVKLVKNCFSCNRTVSSC